MLCCIKLCSTILHSAPVFETCSAYSSDLLNFMYSLAASMSFRSGRHK